MNNGEFDQELAREEIESIQQFTQAACYLDKEKKRAASEFETGVMVEREAFRVMNSKHLTEGERRLMVASLMEAASVKAAFISHREHIQHLAASWRLPISS